ncbi:MAG: hypothetical protein ACK4ZJ_18090, partial [Allorhizobium sp.]
MRQFFAFFRYEPKTSYPDPAEIADFRSICSETFSGWYHNKDKTGWGCFIARKVNHEAHDEGLQPHAAPRFRSRTVSLQRRLEAFDSESPFVADTAFVEMVNSVPNRS